MKLKYKLNKVLKEVDPKLLLHRHGFRTFSVPTECVITEPTTQVFPIQGRVYPTGFFQSARGHLVDYEELVADYDDGTFGGEAGKPPFPGTSAFKQVFLVEVWKDRGCDGHVEYCLCGWMFVLGIPEDPLGIVWRNEK